MFRFVDPKVDIAFKKIFGDSKTPQVLISFLNAVLEKDIVEITILNPYQVPRLEGFKVTVLDVKAKDKNDNEFIVEMQANPYYYFDRRALNYMSNAYANQVKEGVDYKNHKPVYFIGVLNFNYFKSKQYLSKHLIINQETGNQDISLFELYFIELKKFKILETDLKNDLEKWIYFIKEIGKLDKAPDILLEIPEIKTAIDNATTFAWSPEELDFYKKWREAEYQEATMNEMLEISTRALLEKDKQILEKDNVISENIKALSEKDNSLKKAVLKLKSLGISEKEIAETLNITIETITKLTN